MESNQPEEVQDDRQFSMSDTEIVRMWKYWSQEYWAAEFLLPTKDAVDQFRYWLEWAENAKSVDIGGSPQKMISDAEDRLLDLFYDMDDKEDK